MALPLVAVVTPAYNGSPWLERTIRSVQQQTYPNLVHVILDNASTDDTPDVIARAAQNPRVPIITARNAQTIGQTANWNAAVNLCPRDAVYVKLQAADDLMRKDCIDKLTALAESDPEIDFVHAVDVFGDSVKPHNLDPGRPVLSGKEYGARYLKREITWLSATHMFYRATPLRLTDPFTYEVFPLMDNEFIVRELLDRKIGFVFEPLFYTRYVPTSVTAGLGGLDYYMVPMFRVLMMHGAKFFDPAEFQRVKTREVRRLLRHVLRSRFSGDQRLWVSLTKAFEDYGIRPSMQDYSFAVGSWPLYKAQRALLVETGPSARIEESAFLPESHDDVEPASRMTG